MEQVIKRKPFQGIRNIIMFNWHFYLLLVAGFILITYIRGYYFQNTVLLLFQLLLVFSMLSSLAVSYYIYDFSNFYKMEWLQQIHFNSDKKVVNINAGFDETSTILHSGFQNSELIVLDFYNPEKHTEISIKRARKLYDPYPETISIETNSIPLNNTEADIIFLIFAAHEIRHLDERIIFFKELHRILTNGGKIILIEHLRDFANFTAFNIGFFHFFPKKDWIKTLRNANLTIESETKLTPFTSLFIITKNGNPS